MAFPLAAVAIGVDAGLADEFEGGAVERSRGGSETLGGLEDAFSFAGVGGAAGGSGHVKTSSLRPIPPVLARAELCRGAGRRHP